MTFSFIVECNVCHAKYVFKCQCDHVMNHGSMPIRIGCKNCGNILRGEISAQDIVMTKGIKHKSENWMESYPHVGVSTELPICVDCYFTSGQLVNNYMCLPSYVKDASMHNHSKRMHFLADGMNQTLDDLKTLYNIYCNGNISVFSAYAEERFGKNKTETINSKDDMQRVFFNLLIQLFHIIVSKAYYSKFTKPFVEKLDGVVGNTDVKTLEDLFTAISDKMNIENDIDESIKVLMDFVGKMANFFPLMLLLDEGDFSTLYRGKLYLSTVDYTEVKSFYAEAFELLSRWSIFWVGLENIEKRGDYDKLVTIKSLSDFCKLTNGKKSEYISNHSWLKDYYLCTIDNKIRNGIDHVKTNYDAHSQIIEYYPNVNKPNEKMEIALVDFTFIILQQMIKLVESLHLVIMILNRVGKSNV